MPPGERRPPRKSIRPVAVEVALPEPEEPTVTPRWGAYRALIHFDNFAAGVLYQLRVDARTLALVRLGYLREEDEPDGNQDQGPA